MSPDLFNLNSVKNIYKDHKRPIKPCYTQKRAWRFCVSGRIPGKRAKGAQSFWSI